jgi:hypothetical protein
MPFSNTAKTVLVRTVSHLKPKIALLKHGKARRRTLFETENHPSVYLSKPKNCPFESKETPLLLNFVLKKKKPGRCFILKRVKFYNDERFRISKGNTSVSKGFVGDAVW